MFWLETDVLIDAINDHKVITQAMHFCKSNTHSFVLLQVNIKGLFDRMLLSKKIQYSQG